jgi:hypothetical protein
MPSVLATLFATCTSQLAAMPYIRLKIDTSMASFFQNSLFYACTRKKFFSFNPTL